MTRPRMRRRLAFSPNALYFKPCGIPLRTLEEVELRTDELGAVKLVDVDGLNQEAASIRLGVSQPTFSRTLAEARRKIAEAVVGGKALRIQRQ